MPAPASPAHLPPSCPHCGGGLQEVWLEAKRAERRALNARSAQAAAERGGSDRHTRLDHTRTDGAQTDDPQRGPWAQLRELVGAAESLGLAVSLVLFAVIVLGSSVWLLKSMAGIDLMPSAHASEVLLGQAAEPAVPGMGAAWQVPTDPRTAGR